MENLSFQIALKARFSLLDENMFSMVQLLQKKKIPTLAFTASSAGRLKSMDMAKWRISQLRELGLDFSLVFPKMPLIVFPKESSKKAAPMFQSGVLFSSKHPKGDVLKMFLEKLSWCPKRVILIDDTLSFSLLNKPLKRRELILLAFIIRQLTCFLQPLMKISQSFNLPI